METEGEREIVSEKGVKESRTHIPTRTQAQTQAQVQAQSQMDTQIRKTRTKRELSQLVSESGSYALCAFQVVFAAFAPLLEVFPPIGACAGRNHMRVAVMSSTAREGKLAESLHRKASRRGLARLFGVGVGI